MNILYRLPGLFLVAVCHVFVIYFMSEHKYSIKKFMFCGGMFAACFVGLSSFGYEAAGTIGLFSYIGIVACTFLLSCIVSQDCFSKKCFLFITYFCLFSVLDNSLKIIVELLLP